MYPCMMCCSDKIQFYNGSINTSFSLLLQLYVIQ